MKNIFTLVLLFASLSFYGQNKKVSFLNLVGNNIQIPSGCEARSEYELQACNGTSIKWDYYSKDMLSDIFYATITAFSEGRDDKDIVEITLTSFESKLTGYKFNMGTTYQYFVQGVIKDQPLMMSIGTPVNISTNDDLDGFLSLFFDEVSQT